MQARRPQNGLTFPMTHTLCQVILLAAGAGRRFGGSVPKLLSGTPPLILQTLARLRAGLAPDTPILAVVRPESSELHARLTSEGVDVTICASADGGMGNSLSHACAMVANDRPLIVALGDMPAIAPATLTAVQAALLQGNASLVQPQWQGRRGHPVGFHPRWLPALRSLQGEPGARGLLRTHADELQTLPVDDPGILLDIDTQDQLSRWCTSGC